MTNAFTIIGIAAAFIVWIAILIFFNLARRIRDPSKDQNMSVLLRILTNYS